MGKPTAFIDINALGRLAESDLSFEEQQRWLRDIWNRGNDRGITAQDLQLDHEEERRRRRMDQHEKL